MYYDVKYNITLKNSCECLKCSIDSLDTIEITAANVRQFVVGYVCQAFVV